MKKVMLFYPPGRFFQRGEDRSQGNVEQSTATSMRAPNDLGYAAATLKAKGFSVFLRDYQTERLGVVDLWADLERFAPDAVYVSVTNTTVFDDIKLVAALKHRHPNLVVMLKGAIFFNPAQALLNQLDLSPVDYLIGMESEFIVGTLMQAHFFDPGNLPGIRGILYKRHGCWERTDFSSWETDLDSLPFPDRSLINNALYARPDTGDPQATIVTSRGCPSSCIFCMTPTISGAQLRLRSPENILAELRECYFTHGIRNFFFKSDTFTFEPRWTQAVCRRIIDSDLNGKIAWVANSKVKPIDMETLTLMKQAGCWLIAFGYESGSPQTLKLIKKGTTVEDNVRATHLARQAGLRTFGFFLVGLPWETREHLEMTRRHIFALDNDFLELHIAIPYHGTKLHELAQAEGLIPGTVLGKDYFTAPTVGTKSLSMAEIEAFRRRTLLTFHLRPTYILRKLAQANANPKIIANYWRFGLRLLKNTLAARPGGARQFRPVNGGKAKDRGNSDQPAQLCS
jgi:anaerobic magnesium-protoporphyrin IX monomethyl ester cyclase